MKPENFSSPFAPPPCRVTVVIKALNEERHIAAALESALRAVAVVGGEVVQAWRLRSLKQAVYAAAFWSLGALGWARGLLGARAPASQGIASKVLKEPSGLSWLPHKMPALEALPC